MTDLWLTHDQVLSLTPDDFDYVLWELTCFPFTGWKEQLADYVVHGITHAKHDEYLDEMGLR